MLNEQDLSKLRKALPFGALKVISGMTGGLSVSQISRTLNNPKHYRSEIISAAISVAEKSKEDSENLKNQIANL